VSALRPDSPSTSPGVILPVNCAEGVGWARDAFAILLVEGGGGVNGAAAGSSRRRAPQKLQINSPG
jgi:hypothetical protein